jgi:phosphatidylglycerol:prolipoprotein diacylglycerol transferase
VAAQVLATISWPIISRIPLGGDLAVSPHGIGIALGFLLGSWMFVRRAEKRGLGHVYVEDVPESVQRLLGRIAVGAILGARLFYVLTHLDQFAQEPLSALAIWEGGLTFLGGVAGAIIVAMPWAMRQGWRPLQLLDSAVPGLAAGLAVGRIGDLMIGDHVGAPTSFVLGWRCTGDYNPAAGPNAFGFTPPTSYQAAVERLGDQPTIGCFDTAVHQTALYDFGAALFVLLLLLWLERRARFDGFFAAAWVYGYGVVRFAGDFARQDRRLLGLTGSQYALLAAAIVVTVWLVRTRPWERRPWAWDLEFAHPWLSPPEDGATGADEVEDTVEESGADADPVRSEREADHEAR